MSPAVPLRDIEAETERLLGAFAQRGLAVRLIGGLAVARHRHRDVPAALGREYGDIDLVIHPREGKAFRAAMEELGYTPNVRFNNMRGDRRLLYGDEANDRKLDVFVGGFQMCHSLDLADRLGLHPETLAPADLLLTKLQVVEVNLKDLTDALTILLTHEVAPPDAPAPGGDDHVSLDRLVRVTSSDWGWYTTFTDNLSRLPGLAAELLPGPAAETVAGRAAGIADGLAAAPKSLKWRARGKVGRRIPWYELPDEIGGPIGAQP
ncbi:nucleotidyltransferase family protein [Microbispora sp. RL4-1S]|uniref:Nucleotidyltransferase family protein n=1 Tax=Microbispora oryzae TaxID=2806554 RepID=A0A940WH84_9ACTN|nr:nucleotidyltransferase family protein [Microbispora oryzae]MBP2703967.1 nucleotidyltransferase family protein [Microbispora oryzae]